METQIIPSYISRTKSGLSGACLYPPPKDQGDAVIILNLCCPLILYLYTNVGPEYRWTHGINTQYPKMVSKNLLDQYPKVQWTPPSLSARKHSIKDGRWPRITLRRSMTNSKWVLHHDLLIKNKALLHRLQANLTDSQKRTNQDIKCYRWYLIVSKRSYSLCYYRHNFKMWRNVFLQIWQDHGAEYFSVNCERTQQGSDGLWQVEGPPHLPRFNGPRERILSAAFHILTCFTSTSFGLILDKIMTYHDSLIWEIDGPNKSWLPT